VVGGAQDPLSLEGRVAVVTGAGAGLGRAEAAEAIRADGGATATHAFGG